VIQGNFGMFVASESVRFSYRDSGLVVEALGGAVSEQPTGSEPGKELTSMLAQYPFTGFYADKGRSDSGGLS
jgi:hypothetical protein